MGDFYMDKFLPVALMVLLLQLIALVAFFIYKLIGS